MSAAAATLFGGAGTLHATLNDNSDTTYVSNGWGANKVRFATLAIPAGGLVTAVTLRMRMRRPTSSGFTSAQLDSGTILPFNNALVGSTWRTDSSVPQNGFTPAQVAAGVTLTWGTGSTGTTSLSEAYLDVTYVALPVVNVTAPSGTTAVTQPTIIWDTTSDFVQSRYQAKIFTQAQYQAPGFSPTYSGAFWDSNIQSGSASSIVPTPINLTNGLTYGFYVRVAQQVGSTTQWSAWDSTTATVAATPPAPPTIVAAPDDLLARVKLTVTDADAWEFVTIERTADGMHWTPVRGANRSPVFGATFVVYDYESCNSQLVRYRATAIKVTGGQDVASDWSETSSEVQWSSLDTWLKSPIFPSANTTVRINELPSVKFRNPQGVFDVPGRRDPIVVSAARKLMEGQVTFVTVTDLELDLLFTLLDRSEVLILQTPPEDGWDCHYITIGDVDENRVGRLSYLQERLIVCPFVEVLAPATEIGATIGGSVTWTDVAALYATWTALATANASWNQLAGL